MALERLDSKRSRCSAEDEPAVDVIRPDDRFRTTGNRLGRLEPGHYGALYRADIDAIARPVSCHIQVLEPGLVRSNAVAKGSGQARHVALTRSHVRPDILPKEAVLALSVFKVDERLPGDRSIALLQALPQREHTAPDKIPGRRFGSALLGLLVCEGPDVRGSGGEWPKQRGDRSRRLLLRKLLHVRGLAVVLPGAVRRDIRRQDGWTLLPTQAEAPFRLLLAQ